MTAPSAIRPRRDGSGRPEAGGVTGAAPVIVLTYPHAGAEALRSLLAGHPDLACTSGTGILPLCDAAAATWRGVDGREDGALPALAAASVRALAAGLITALLAREGKRRWCETVSAPPGTAGTFLRLYPGTQVLCLHRSCPGFIDATLKASRWGLAGAAFAPFTAAYPASTVAALTAFWTAHTAPLIEFEQAHPRACYRLRYEDLASGPNRGLFPFLGLDAAGPDAAGPDLPSLIAGRAVPPDAGGPAPAIPAEQIPPPLLAQASDLMNRLGYPPFGGNTRRAQPGPPSPHG